MPGNSTVVRPLDGVHVLEISHYIAGPYCAQILGDQGADVVKLEPPGGEPARRALPLNEAGESLYYASYNRNKRNVEVDLTGEGSRTALDALLRWADIVVTNYSVDVPDKLGFGWDHVRKVNPRAVMVLITGFGSYSSYRDYVAFDGIVTAMSGIASLTGGEEGPPYVGNTLLGDHVTAHQAALAAITALHLRERTGGGTFVEVSMLRSLAALLGDYVPAAATLGEDPQRHGNRSKLRFGGTFPTADGFVIVAPLTPKMWARFCDLLGRPEWGEQRIAEQRIHVHDEVFRAEIEAVLMYWMATRSSQAIVDEFQSLGIPAGNVTSVRTLTEDDEPKGLRLFESVSLANGGEAKVVGRVFDWGGSRIEAPTANRVSALGNESLCVLKEAGLDDDLISKLVTSGTVRDVSG